MTSVDALALRKENRIGLMMRHSDRDGRHLYLELEFQFCPYKSHHITTISEEGYSTIYAKLLSVAKFRSLLEILDSVSPSTETVYHLGHTKWFATSLPL